MGKKVNQTELAEITGVSDVSLWAWQKEGMPVEERNTRGQSNVYDTADVIEWMVSRAVKKVREESPRDALARAQTELVQIQIAEKQGTLVPLAEAEAEYERMVVRCRQRLLQIGATLPMEDATRAQLVAELRGALTELSRHDTSAGDDRQGVGQVGDAESLDGTTVGGTEAVLEREELAVPGQVQVGSDALSPGGAGRTE